MTYPEQFASMDVPPKFRTEMDSFRATAEFAAAQLRKDGVHLVGIDRHARPPQAYFAREPIAAAGATWKPLEGLPDKPSDSAVVAEAKRLAGAENSYIVGIDYVGKRAEFAPIPPAYVDDIINVIVARLQTDPWKVRVAVGIHEDGRLDTLTVHTREVSKDAEKALQDWRHIISELPGGSTGWLINQDRENGVTTLTWGAPRALAPIVPLGDVLPSAVSNSWEWVAFGKDALDREVGWDVKAGPHGVVAGSVGSGKTMTLLALGSGALLKGFRVRIVDPMKGGADFKPIEEFVDSWVTSIADAAAELAKVYAEGQRRKAILLEHGVGHWSRVPADVLLRENIAPDLTIIDEFASLVIETVIPKALPKDDPGRLKDEALNLAKAQLMQLTGKVARELRFVGMHLFLALQRSDAAFLGGEMRQNLATAVQMKAPSKPIQPEALRMLFPGDAAEQAVREFRELDSSNPGFGVVASEGGDVVGFRGAWAPEKDIPEMLRSRGVQPGRLVRPVTPQPVAVVAPATQSPAPEDDWLP